MGENQNRSSNFANDQLQPRDPEAFIRMKEDKKLLDEKLQKIMDNKINQMATKKQKKDEVDDDPLFGNKNPFTGATDVPINNSNHVPTIESIDEVLKIIRLYTNC